MRARLAPFLAAFSIMVTVFAILQPAQAHNRPWHLAESVTYDFQRPSAMDEDILETIAIEFKITRLPGNHFPNIGEWTVDRIQAMKVRRSHRPYRIPKKCFEHIALPIQNIALQSSAKGVLLILRTLPEAEADQGKSVHSSISIQDASPMPKISCSHFLRATPY